MDLFEEASRLKLRFTAPGLTLTTEDLWGLPLQSTTGKASLDSIGMELVKKAEASNVTSLVDEGRTGDPAIQLALGVVKRVIAVKKEENTKKLAEGVRKEEKQKLLALIADKKDESLKGLSIEELERRFAAL